MITSHPVEYYLYIESGSEPLIDVYAQAPARKVDVYGAVVVKTTEQSTGYCRGYACSYADNEGVIVAVVWLRSKKSLTLAIRDSTTGQISFRAPTPGEITRKQYRVTPLMLSSWQSHMDAASASVTLAKEKRASKLKQPRKASTRTVKSADSSESDSSEVILQRAPKRKNESAVEVAPKRQKTGKLLFQLSDNLADHDVEQEVVFAEREEVTKLQRQFTTLNERLNEQQIQIHDLMQEAKDRTKTIKQLTDRVVTLEEDLASTKAKVALLSVKNPVATQLNPEPVFQTPEKVRWIVRLSKHVY